MASALLKRSGMVKSMASYAGGEPSMSWMSRTLASFAAGTDLVSTVPNVPLQKGRTWDEGVSSKFSTTSPSEIFKGAFTGVCSAQHVPSYKNNIDKFKARDDIKFYGGFGGSFRKSLDLGIDPSAALLGPRSRRLSTHVVDGKVKALNVEKAPSEFNVSGGGATVLRPLSPHLTIYKPQLSSTYSILHRIAYMSAVAIVFCIALLCSKVGFLFFV